MDGNWSLNTTEKGRGGRKKEGKDLFRMDVVGNGSLNSTEGGRKDLSRIRVVGNGSLNSTERGEEVGRKGREGSVQDGCGWQRKPELHGGREGRKEGKGG